MNRFLLAAVPALAVAACTDPCPTTPGTLCTYLGTGYAGLGHEGQDRADTPLYLPQDVTVGPDGRVYVMDWNNHRVRRVETDDTVTTVIGTGELGEPHDGHALHASLNHPTHVLFAPDGQVILSAWHNSKVMRWDPQSGELTTLAGTGRRAFSGDEGPADAADLDLPVATALAPDGSLYVADQANQRVRKVTPDGLIHTVVGTGAAGYAGDDGPALEAQLQGPFGQAASPSGKIVTDRDGNLYIADSGNHRVRKVTADGVIRTIAGTGDPHGALGDGGPALQASLSRPTDLAFGPDGSLYVADTDHSCVRRVTPDGLITTAAGVCGEAGDAREPGPATQARLNRPFGIDVGPDGTLYVADTYNHRVRIVRPEKARGF